MFAMTSGTTANAKYIPITRASLDEYQASWTIWGCGIAERHPTMPYGGVINLASSHRAAAAPSGVPCGSITGLLFAMMHRTLRVTNCIPPDVALVDDPALRQYLALRLALPRNDTMMVNTANPSTLLGFAKRLDDLKGDLVRDLHDGTLREAEHFPRAVRDALSSRLSARHVELARRLERAAANGPLWPKVAWPRLELLGVWTGGTLSSYLQQLPTYYGDIALRDHGLSASEGRMTIPLADGVPHGPLNVNGSFYEFVPEEEHGTASARVLLAHELEPGARYYIVVTTSGGLVRYDLADVVECVGFEGTAPLLRFLNKGTQIANITGEKLSAWQVTQAVTRVQSRLGVYLGEYVVAPAFADPPGYHLLLEEAVFPGPELEARLAAGVEEELLLLNIEYADKRKSRRLAPLQLTPAKDGCFAALKAERLARGGAAPEQYKHPFLVTDLDFVARVAARPAATRRSG
jgi:hypothetical protein